MCSVIMYLLQMYRDQVVSSTNDDRLSHDRRDENIAMPPSRKRTSPVVLNNGRKIVRSPVSVVHDICITLLIK